MLQLHHAFPKYLGGAADQVLVELQRSVHEAYHAGLDQLLPRRAGTAYYQALSPEGTANVFQQLGAFTKQFDAEYGTQLYDALLQNGFPGGP